MKKSLIVLNGFLLGLLFTSLVTSSQACSINSIQDIVSDIHSIISQNKALTPHDPIIVDGDSGFIDYGFSGNGSIVSPYIIEGYSIINSSFVDGIVVENTTKHFKIINCNVEVNGSGIHVGYVANGTAVIANNHLKGSYRDGIAVVEADNTIVTNNTILGKYTGLSIKDCSGVYAYNNTLIGIGTSYEGISTYYSTDIYIINNTVTDYMIGISPSVTSFSLIANNTIISSTKYGGIRLGFRAKYNLIINNTILNSLNGGIWFHYSEFNEVCYNTVRNSTGYGCSISYQSENNVVHHNNFINNNNNAQQGFAYYSTNIWYQYSTSEGNFWSDWDGLDSYDIVNSTSHDLYPLESLAVMNWSGFQFSISIDDILEENDRLEDAPEIPCDESLHLIYSDIDFFQFTINESYIVNIFVEFDSYTIDLDLYLLPYNFTGSQDEILASGRKAFNKDYIYINALAPGKYYLLVECHDVSFDITVYTLKITLSEIPVTSSLPSFIWYLATFISAFYIISEIIRKQKELAI